MRGKSLPSALAPCSSGPGTRPAAATRPAYVRANGQVRLWPFAAISIGAVLGSPFISALVQRGGHPLIRPCPGHSGLALAPLAVGTPRPWLYPGHCPGNTLAILAFDVRHKPSSALAILAKFRQRIGIPRPQPKVRRQINCSFPAPFSAVCKCTYRQPPDKAGGRSSTLDHRR